MSKKQLDLWKPFCHIERNHRNNFNSYGFKRTIQIGDVNRLSARYTLAYDFESINVSNMQNTTIKGYSSLLRCLLTWGVIESYYELFPNSTGGIAFFYNYNLDKKDLLLSKLREIPDTDKLYQFIQNDKNTNPTHKENITLFLNGNNCNPSYLLSGIRHVFGHGILTGNVDKINTIQLEKISYLLRDFFLDLVNEHFTQTVKNHQNFNSL